MRFARNIKRLLGNLFRRHNIEATLDEELRGYVDELTERNIAKGMRPEEARRLAGVEAGGVEQVKEQIRQEWLGLGIESVLQDIRYAWRSLLRSPGFTFIVVATLVLGIGSALTMFSLMRAVLWRPLPYPEPDRIVAIQVDARNVHDTGATLGEVLDLKQRSHSFEQVSMIDTVDADLQYMGETEHLAAARVSDDFLPLLGANPAFGRRLDSRIDETISAGDRQPLAVLISDELWRRRFSSDRSVIGEVVLINNLGVRIAGVLPAGFRLLFDGSQQIDIWFPYRMNTTRQYRGVPIAARLKPGVTLGQANAELQKLAAQFEREHPEYYSSGKGWQASPFDHTLGAKIHFTAHRLQDDLTRDVRPALFLLSGAVTFVLLIACVNVANLMLAHGSARQRELDIRRALGAGRGRIVRQLLTESLLLALASAVAGLFCAHFGLQVIGQLGASYLPLNAKIELDSSVTLFALLLSVVTSVIFGLLPAWRLASGKTDNPLTAGRSETSASGARKLQRTLVVAEVALSIVPLACGGLMLRSFVNLIYAPLGFNPADILVAKVPFNFKRYQQTDQRWTLLQDVMNHVRALPGVEGVSAASPLPFDGNPQTRRVGRADQSDALPILATQQGAIPGYLNVIGTPLLAGRDFTAADIVTEAEAKVTIIDDRLAKRLWPEGAIGKRLAVYRTGWRHDLEVIGVIVPVRAKRVRDDSVPHFMLPDEYPPSLVIKTHETPARMAPGIQLAVQASHTGRAAFDITPLTDYVAHSIGDTRFILFVLAAFAGMSILLAAGGLYGTLACLTALRTREFGIRLALGASVQAIVTIVIRECFLLTAAGIALGLLGSIACTRAIREMLYRVQPLDAITLLAVAGLVGLIALAAASIPAWRATRIDPQQSLRTD